MVDDYIVEVVIKDRYGGNGTPKVDCFKGDVNGAIAYLTSKYSTRRNLLTWLYSPLQVSNNEMRLLDAKIKDFFSKKGQ